jgi:hypothetical protein
VAPACARIWRYKRPPQEISLSSGVRLSTPLYAMWNGDAVGKNPNQVNAGITTALRPVPRELEEALRAGGDTRAVIVPVPLRYEDLGNFGKALQSMNVKTTPMLAQIAVHESYHLHSQIPSWLDQPRRYDWPAWDMQPDRRTLVERCYNAAGAVHDTHKKELASLQRAWRLLMGTRDATSDARAIADARAFIAARRERYVLLGGVTVPSPPAVPVSCERAEDVMELEEGAPQWIGYATALNAGLISVAQVGSGGSEAFYASGTWQLWIIERLIGADSMRAVTRDIGRSAQPSGPNGAVFGRFTAIVESR